MKETEKTITMFNYINWRGDLTFCQSPVNEVDALIFSSLTYLNFSVIPEGQAMVFKDVAAKIMELPDEEKYLGPSWMIYSVVKCAQKAAESARFQNLLVSNFVDLLDQERQLQFSAITFYLPDGSAFLAYRGTDEHLIGWKEDFNMSFEQSEAGVPAQLEASLYANHVLEKFKGPFYLGGHSKGGNLSVWTGAHLDDDNKNRLLQIYNLDGPGFSKDFIQGNSYQLIQDKILSFVPQSSIVGVIMHHGPYTTIKSYARAAMQHDPFTWEVMGPHLVSAEGRSRFGNLFEHTFNTWLEAMSLEERKEFTDVLFDLISSGEINTVEDFSKHLLKSSIHMLKNFKNMDIEKHDFLVQSFKDLMFSL